MVVGGSRDGIEEVGGNSHGIKDLQERNHEIIEDVGRSNHGILPEDFRRLDLGAIWNYSKASGLP